MGVLAIVLIVTFNASVFGDDREQLTGNWAGESLCTGAYPSCHDEKVVYRIAKSPDGSDKVIITMDKIVEGKPETMAVLEFTYDKKKQTLVNEFTRGTTHGVWEFTVKDNVIEGKLFVLPARTVARQVKVKKSE